jgi:hypothetical protein
MSMDLFIEPATYPIEKSAAEVAMPEDPNTWPNEILQELYKQVPYIADFDPSIVMDRVDAERGYGFGHVEVMNKTEIQRGASPEGLQAAGVRQVRIPVIIRDRKLQPFDVLVTEESKMLPLTESRLRQAIFRPQAFDITGRTPGDMSMIGQLYPPYRQNYGFGGGGATMSVGMGKEGEKTASILEAILPTINESDYISFFEQVADPHLQAAFMQNAAAVAPSFQKLASYVPVSRKKTAGLLPSLIKPTVAQVVRDNDGYVLKTANHRFWAPLYQNLDRGEVVQRFGEKVALAADTSGAVTLADAPEPAVDPEADHAELIHQFGLYKVKDTDGRELVGFVFPNLIDLDGAALPIALFTNGSQAATQGEIVGVRSGEGTSLPEDAVPSGNGVFYKVLSNGRAQATIPITISGSYSGPDSDEGLHGENSVSSSALMGETFDGRQVELHLDQPNLERITEGPNGDVLVPAGFKWLSLGKADEVALVSDPTLFHKTAEARHSLASVTVRSGGASCFSFSGMPIDKLAHDQREFLSIDDAFFLLGGLGVDPSTAATKLAQAYTWNEPVEIRVMHALMTAQEMRKVAQDNAQATLAKIPALRCSLLKEAATIPDPMAVDAVLSLGFVNPENLTTFISYIPKIEEAQSHLCELLIAARLGLQEVPTPPLEKAVRSLEEVLEGLKVLGFEQPTHQ